MTEPDPDRDLTLIGYALALQPVLEDPSHPAWSEVMDAIGLKVWAWTGDCFLDPDEDTEQVLATPTAEPVLRFRSGLGVPDDPPAQDAPDDRREVVLPTVSRRPRRSHRPRRPHAE